ncbi:MAG: hypothetical protein IJP31_06775 [Lachnospiraceae bacterium]|nr:hypothetical protein [Lachnospiraceae bacterium]
MERYSSMTCGLLLLAAFVAPIVGIAYCLYKKSLQKWWIFALITGFSGFEGMRHGMIGIAYDDISDPNYGTYGGWTLTDFIVSDIRHLLVWAVIAFICYLGFEKRKKLPLVIGHIICGFSSVATIFILVMMLLEIIAW